MRGVGVREIVGRGVVVIRYKGVWFCALSVQLSIVSSLCAHSVTIPPSIHTQS